MINCRVIKCRVIKCHQTINSTVVEALRKIITVCFDMRAKAGRKMVSENTITERVINLSIGSEWSVINDEKLDFS